MAGERVFARAMIAAVVLAGLSGASVGSPPSEAGGLVDGPFGMHGPQFSHWLAAGDPNLWWEGDARLRVFRDTGATWARQDFWWGLCEPQKGEFRWNDFDRAMAAYEREGINLLVILCYSSAWSGGAGPQTDDERAAFANYVFEMVRRYKAGADKGKWWGVGAWEIWNEPNIQPFWEPRPDPELYTKLLKAAYAAAKKADPDCVIVGGVLAGPDLAFLEGMYQHGAKGSFDVLSYHNYGQELDVTTEWPAVEKMRAIMRRYGDGDKPIWHTETGLFTGPVGLSEHDQASRIVRYSIGLLALGIEKTFQLTLNDWTDDPEHHDLSVYRGLTHADYRVKASYAAYRTMCLRLNDKRFVAAIRPAPGVSGFLFAGDDGETVLAMWRQWGAESAPTQLDLDMPVILVQHLDGDWTIHRNEGGKYELAIGQDPVYVVNPGPAITNQKLVRWDNPVISSVPRCEDAGVDVEVTNPTPRPLQLFVASPQHREEKIKPALTVGPDSTRAARILIDTSRMDVGRHDMVWRLSHEDAANPLAVGRRLVEVESPVRLSFGRLGKLVASAPKLPVRIEYAGAKAATGSLSLRLAGESGGEPVRVNLEPGDARTAELPLSLKTFDGGKSVPIELRLETSGLEITTTCERALIACPAAPSEAKIDGKLDEWKSMIPPIQPQMLRWEYVNATEAPAAEDLTVTAWVAYDARGLWVAVEAKDDVLAFPETRAVWNWDSLQVGLDMGSDARPDEPYDGNDYEVEVGFNSSGPAWCYLGACPPGWPQEALSAKLVAAVRADRDGSVTTYELLIPASLMVSSTTLEPGTVMGFSILVNDNDGSGRAGWQELTPGIGMGKTPARFAWLWLR
ncbi:MAG: hypothetical protein JSV19_01930 [Phycisphaerales bacterium]|nr:MAG: hypothetical protein JSV19_01930 [Phycisphaerales bacterium]